jgi:hypothetical protein
MEGKALSIQAGMIGALLSAGVKWFVRPCSPDPRALRLPQQRQAGRRNRTAKCSFLLQFFISLNVNLLIVNILTVWNIN